MSDLIELGAEAMRAKRRELINQPLDRIWPDLMRAAVDSMREPTPAMVQAGHDSLMSNSQPIKSLQAYRDMISVIAAPPRS